MTKPIYVPPNPHRDVWETENGVTFVYRFVRRSDWKVHEKVGWHPANPDKGRPQFGCELMRLAITEVRHD